MVKPMTPTKLKKRRAILLDARKQILRGLRYRRNADYVNGQYENQDLNFPEQLGATQADELQAICHVCALGGLFLSRMRLFNEIPRRCLTRRPAWPGNSEVDRITVQGAEFWEILSGVFTSNELHDIETAFEGDGRPLWSGIRNDSNRAFAIIQNMLDHDTKFRPDVEYYIVDPRAKK